MEHKDPYVESFKKSIAKNNCPLLNKNSLHYGDFDGLTFDDWDDLVLESDIPKCDCGTEKTIKDATLEMHSDWCSYRIFKEKF